MATRFSPRVSCKPSQKAARRSRMSRWLDCVSILSFRKGLVLEVLSEGCRGRLGRGGRWSGGSGSDRDGAPRCAAYHPVSGLTHRLFLRTSHHSEHDTTKGLGGPSHSPPSLQVLTQSPCTALSYTPQNACKCPSSRGRSHDEPRRDAARGTTDLRAVALPTVRHGRIEGDDRPNQ